MDGRITPENESVKSKSPLKPGGFRGLSLNRSGETRTRGLLLPKQARYQLRNTPAVWYSIPRLGRFVNRELCAAHTLPPAA